MAGFLRDLNELQRQSPAVKYDGKRSYYAGMDKPEVTIPPALFPMGGAVEAGNRVYYFIGIRRDYSGRVIYSDFTTVLASLPSTSEVQFTIKYQRTYAYGGMGSMAVGKAVTANSVVPVYPLHGLQVNDIVYSIPTKDYLQVYNINEAHIERRVLAHRGGNITLDGVVTAVNNWMMIANSTLLILRTKIGGVTPYVVGEMAYPESLEFLPNLQFYIKDTIPDAQLIETFDLPGAGREAERLLNGSAAELINGRIVVGRGSAIYWSLPDSGRESLEHMPLTNNLAVGSTVPGNITAISSTNKKVFYVFKKLGIYRIEGVFENANGFPELAQGVINENDLGVSNAGAIARMGGVLVCFGNGQLYGIAEDSIFREIGKPIVERTRGARVDWRANISVDSTTGQLKVVLSTNDYPIYFYNALNTGQSLAKYEYRKRTETFVLDPRGALGAVNAQDGLILSRDAFDSSWFPWEFEENQPTSSFVNLGTEEFYLSNAKDFLTTQGQGAYSQGVQGDFSEKRIDIFSGLFLRWNELIGVTENGGRKQYNDNGRAIPYSVTLTPLHDGQPDQLKTWTYAKIYRYLTESDDVLTTDWNAKVNLFWNLSNNRGSILSSIQRDVTYTSFPEKQDTMAIIPLSGNQATALEIQLIVKELYKTLNFSALVVDYTTDHVVENVEIRGED
jgi:hypothetical protein